MAVTKEQREQVEKYLNLDPGEWTDEQVQDFLDSGL